MQLREVKFGTGTKLDSQNLSRSEATAAMLALMKNLQPQPTQQELQAIQDPAFSLQSSASRISQCFQEYTVGRYRLAMIDIDRISATPISDATVLVKTRNFLPNSNEGTEQSYQKGTA